ncbi:MAG: YqgE/AlgH family protein [Cyclobacteriaceae bacterium]|nr:YqgE/AlgH family protein [Cyclobacteriaceae bacterium HetDA_MAG_MS6]
MDYFAADYLINPEKGDLLISEPYLGDPNFERTVVLLCEHSEENGSFGFVLNRQSKASFDEVVEDVSDFDADLYLGGPVQQDSLHFLHRAPDQIDSGKPVSDSIFWGGDFERLLMLINTRQIHTEDFRFFVGYSGWSPGQLLEELKTKSWIVFKNAGSSLIFDTKPEELWRRVLHLMGGKFKVIANYPEDPRLN